MMTDAYSREHQQRVATLLEAVASGKLSAKDALALTIDWADIPWEKKIFSAAYHALQHFDADEDIRSGDSDYAVSQIESLKILSQKILKASKRDD